MPTAAVSGFQDDFEAENVFEEGAQAMFDSLFVSRANQKAQTSIGKCIDYLLIVIVLLLQYLSCAPDYETVLTNAVNGEPLQVEGLYSCNIEEELLGTSDLFGTVITSLLVGFGVLTPIVLWLHSRKFNSGEEGTVNDKKVQGIYNFTNRFIIIDTIMEMPIAFYFAPQMTLFLWFTFAAIILGIVYTVIMFFDKPGSDDAKNTFAFTSFMVGFALYRLIGELSQYWVFYVTAVSEDAGEKLDEYEQENTENEKKKEEAEQQEKIKDQEEEKEEEKMEVAV